MRKIRNLTILFSAILLAGCELPLPDGMEELTGWKQWWYIDLLPEDLELLRQVLQPLLCILLPLSLFATLYILIKLLASNSGRNRLVIFDVRFWERLGWMFLAGSIVFTIPLLSFAMGTLLQFSPWDLDWIMSMLGIDLSLDLSDMILSVIFAWYVILVAYGHALAEIVTASFIALSISLTIIMRKSRWLNLGLAAGICWLIRPFEFAVYVALFRLATPIMDFAAIDLAQAAGFILLDVFIASLIYLAIPIIAGFAGPDWDVEGWQSAVESHFTSYLRGADTKTVEDRKGVKVDGEPDLDKEDGNGLDTLVTPFLFPDDDHENGEDSEDKASDGLEPDEPPDVTEEVEGEGNDVGIDDDVDDTGADENSLEQDSDDDFVEEDGEDSEDKVSTGLEPDQPQDAPGDEVKGDERNDSIGVDDTGADENSLEQDSDDDFVEEDGETNIVLDKESDIADPESEQEQKGDDGGDTDTFNTEETPDDDKSRHTKHQDTPKREEPLHTDQDKLQTNKSLTSEVDEKQQDPTSEEDMGSKPLTQVQESEPQEEVNDRITDIDDGDDYEDDNNVPEQEEPLWVSDESEPPPDSDDKLVDNGGTYETDSYEF